MRRQHAGSSVNRAQRRHRAGWLMKGVAAVCAATALGLGGYELHVVGVQQFMFRPPGVGASPGDH